MASERSGVIHINVRSWRFAWATSRRGNIRGAGMKLPRIGGALVLYVLMRRAKAVRRE